jgi:hypothetical protein
MYAIQTHWRVLSLFQQRGDSRAHFGSITHFLTRSVWLSIFPNVLYETRWPFRAIIPQQPSQTILPRLKNFAQLHLQNLTISSGPTSLPFFQNRQLSLHKQFPPLGSLRRANCSMGTCPQGRAFVALLATALLGLAAAQRVDVVAPPLGSDTPVTGRVSGVTGGMADYKLGILVSSDNGATWWDKVRGDPDILASKRSSA